MSGNSATSSRSSGFFCFICCESEIFCQHLFIWIKKVKKLFIPVDENGKYSQCKMYDVNYEAIEQAFANKSLDKLDWPVTGCRHGWTYNFTGHFTTVSTELNWVCEDEWKSIFSQSLFFIGSLVGTLCFGWAADNCGRYPTILSANFLLFLSAIATPFMTFHDVAFFCIRFVTGLTHGSYIYTFYMLALEYVGKDKRALIGNLSLAIFLTIGGVYQPWLIKLVGSWQVYHHILFGQTALMLIAPWLMHESSRWLIHKGRVEECLTIITHIASRNGRPVSAETLQSIKEWAEKSSREASRKQSSHSWTDLFKTPRLRKHMLLMIVTWMLIAGVFDGHTRNIENLNSSLLTSFTMSSLLELPADLLAIWGLNNLGRRWSASLSMLCSALSMVACTICLDNSTWMLVFAMIGRFFITYSMNAGVAISFEIVPTQLRGQGSALAQVLSCLTMFLSPYVVYSATFWQPLPFLILAAGGLIGSITAIFLPETADTNLPDLLEEAEEFGKHQSFFHMPMFSSPLCSSQTKNNQA